MEGFDASDKWPRSRMFWDSCHWGWVGLGSGLEANASDQGSNKSVEEATLTKVTRSKPAWNNSSLCGACSGSCLSS